MRWLATVTDADRDAVSARTRLAARLDEELRFHLERADCRERRRRDERGRSALGGAAHASAIRRCCASRPAPRGAGTWLESLLRDVRYGVRTLRRTPGFAAIAILVMALGIGANVALFTVVRSVLLKPLPFNDPDRLVMVYETRCRAARDSNTTWLPAACFRRGSRRTRFRATWPSPAVANTTCRARTGSCRKSCMAELHLESVYPCWACSRRWAATSPQTTIARRRRHRDADLGVYGSAASAAIPRILGQTIHSMTRRTQSSAYCQRGSLIPKPDGAALDAGVPREAGGDDGVRSATTSSR